MAATVGVVLAGGTSRRMEQPKALLTLPNGKSFIERALELLTRVTALQLVAGGDAEWMPIGIQP